MQYEIDMLQKLLFTVRKDVKIRLEASEIKKSEIPMPYKLKKMDIVNSNSNNCSVQLRGKI